MGGPGTTITIMSLFSELRRRNVFKVLLIYLIAGWLIVKLLHHLHPVIGLPHWIEIHPCVYASRFWVRVAQRLADHSPPRNGPILLLC